MRTPLLPEIEAGRVAGAPGDLNGMFRLLCPALGRTLAVVACDGADWHLPVQAPTAAELARVPPDVRAKVLTRFGGRRELPPLPPPAWEHVSVSARSCPTWAEMCWVKNLFWGPEECVVQFHPPESEYVNDHEHVLHLWKVIGAEFPRPPKECV